MQATHLQHPLSRQPSCVIVGGGVTHASIACFLVNHPDRNALIGQHPDLSNSYLANGFSGHGLQQSPAVGRGTAELIVDGQFTQLDFSVFAPGRITENRPLVERNIV